MSGKRVHIIRDWRADALPPRNGKQDSNPLVRSRDKPYSITPPFLVVGHGLQLRVMPLGGERRQCRNNGGATSRSRMNGVAPPPDSPQQDVGHLPSESRWGDHGSLDRCPTSGLGLPKVCQQLDSCWECPLAFPAGMLALLASTQRTRRKRHPEGFSNWPGLWTRLGAQSHEWRRQRLLEVASWGFPWACQPPIYVSFPQTHQHKPTVSMPTINSGRSAADIPPTSTLLATSLCAHSRSHAYMHTTRASTSECVPIRFAHMCACIDAQGLYTIGIAKYVCHAVPN